MKELYWDSEFFGVSIAAADLESATLDDEIDAAGTAGTACLYIACPASRPGDIEAAIRRGARLVDLRTTLVRRGVPPDHEAATAGVRAAGPADRQEVEHAAVALATASRFAADPQFARERVNEMYRLWANSCLGAGSVVVAGNGNHLSFVGVSTRSGVACLDLVYVAPSRRGSGVGRVLVEAALTATATDAARVVTQVGNIPAQRLYESAGFKVESASVILHLWLDPLIRG